MANETFIIANVTAMYPKIDKPYRYDDKAGEKGGWVECKATDAGAVYKTNFVMEQSVAEDLYTRMEKIYAGSRRPNWPEELKAPVEIFKETDEGTWEGSTNIKGQYNNRIVPVPDQFDSNANLLPEGFQLTSGSTVNIMVEFVPYAMSKENYGVSLRLRQVQVVKLAERQAYNPFKKVEGGFVAGNETTPSFGALPEIEDGMEEVKEPEKVVKMKSKEKATTPATEEDLSGLVNKWGTKKK